VGAHGLLDKVQALIEDILDGQEVLGIPAREQRLDVRLQLLDLLIGLSAVQPGHDDVEQQEPDLLLLLFEFPDGILAILCLDYPAAVLFQKGLCQASK
jgi:hypothetical protein